MLNTYSQLEEALRFLNSQSENKKTENLLQHIHAMRPRPVGDKKYDLETIIRAFEYFISRSLYSRLRQDCELPSTSLLIRLTSKLSAAFDDYEFIDVVFSDSELMRQKYCLLLIDEVYVKPCLTYHGGTIFGKATNNPDKLATTVLSFMLVSLC